MSKLSVFLVFLMAFAMLSGIMPAWASEISTVTQTSHSVGSAFVFAAMATEAPEATEAPVEEELSFWDHLLSFLFIVFVVVALVIPAVLILVLGPLYLVLGLVSLLVPALKPCLPPMARVIQKSFRILLFFVTLAFETSDSDSDGDSDSGGGGSFGGGGSGRSW